MLNLRKLAEHFRADAGAFGNNEWGLDPTTIMESWVAQESSWDPWATREEPAFYRKYIEQNPEINRAESWQLSISWGLLQVMGVVARERGFTGRYLSQLCNPSLSLFYGLKYLMYQKGRGDGEWSQALAAYNGGIGKNRVTGNLRNQSYVDEIIGRAKGAS